MKITISFLKNKELDELYISTAIRSFALSMLSIFVPIYLLKEGYSFSEVVYFFIIMNAFNVLFVIPSAKFSLRFGFKHSIFFSTPFLILFYFLLYALNDRNIPLYLIALVYALNNALFWMGYHLDFAKFSDGENRGKEVGVATIVRLVFNAIGPTLGGLILMFFNFQVLFVIVSVLLLASTIPLFYSKDVHYQYAKFSFKRFLRFLKNNKRNFLAMFAYGSELMLSMLIWSIFIFYSILDENFAVLGLVSSVSFGMGILFVIFGAYFSDIKRHLTLKIGSFLNFLVWIFRIFVSSTWQVFAVDSLRGLARSFLDTSFDAISYDKANKEKIINFITLRELAIQSGKGIVLIFVLLFTSLKAGFVIGALTSLFLLFF